MAAPHPLEARVTRALRVAGLAGRDALLLIAASGGPDSTALLAALVGLRTTLRLRLHAVHVDHRLRPDSASDALYVRRLGRRWEVPVTVRRVDVAGRRAARRLSLEEAARQARYAVLAQVARQTGADAVLVAHTADDQVETVLLSLLRGTGLRGMAGMRAVSSLPPVPGEPPPPLVSLVRPLLEASRAQVQTYLRVRRLRPRQDPTNLSPLFLRNRVRSELLPFLEELRPGAHGALGRLAVAAREAVDALETVAADAWASVARGRSGAVYLATGRLGRLSPAVRTLVLQRAAREMAGTLEGFTARHWAAMTRLLGEGRPGAVVQLPHGLRLTALYGEATLTRGDLPCPLPAVEEGALATPGETAAGGWLFRATPLDSGLLRLEAGPRIPSRLVGLPLPGPLAVQVPTEDARALTVRARRAGDRLRLPGGSRKLQDILADARVPRSWRDKVPVVVDARTGDILWAVGVLAGAGLHAL